MQVLKEKTDLAREIDEAWVDVKLFFDNLENIDCKGIDKMRQTWVENKGWLLPHFGGSLRKEVQIKDFVATYSQREINDLFRTYYDTAKKMLRKSDKFSAELGIDGGEAAYESLRKILDSNFEPRFIAINKIGRELEDPMSKRMLDPESKISKFIVSFVKLLMQENRTVLSSIYSNADVVSEYMVTVYSQLLSTMKTANKKVVLSIHPLDIIMSSVHTTSWRSCHNVIDGQYATGPISLMLDGSTVISYAYQSNSILPQINKEYAKKEWRSMVYFHKGFHGCIFGKQYPNNIEAFVTALSSLSQEVLVSLSEGVNKPEDFKFQYGSTQIRTVGGWHFQDSTTGRHSLSGDNFPTFITGVSCVVCPKCGKPRSDGRCRNRSCERCEDSLTCSYCDGQVSDENVFRYDDENYCNTCYHDLFLDCDECGDTISRNDHVYFITNNDNIICGECRENYSICDDCDEIFYQEEINEVEGRNVCDGCLDNYIQCSSCNDFVSESNIIELYSGEDLCPHCVDQYTMRCPSCDELIMTTDSVPTEDGVAVCDSCVHVCSLCLDGFQHRDSLNDNEICESCEEDTSGEFEEEAV